MKNQVKRKTPNPNSKLLTKAIVAGAGLNIPQGVQPPAGYGAVLLFIPATELSKLNPLEIQADLGMPWSDGTSGPGVWFDDLKS